MPSDWSLTSPTTEAIYLSLLDCTSDVRKGKRCALWRFYTRELLISRADTFLVYKVIHDLEEII
jgi:hypothetical protein